MIAYLSRDKNLRNNFNGVIGTIIQLRCKNKEWLFWLRNGIKIVDNFQSKIFFHRILLLNGKIIKKYGIIQ